MLRSPLLIENLFQNELQPAETEPCRPVPIVSELLNGLSLKLLPPMETRCSKS